MATDKKQSHLGSSSPSYYICRDTLIRTDMNLHEANILIVDDDKDVLTAVRFLLKMEAKNVLTESNPENIRRLLLSHEIDILLLDMNFKSTLNNGNEGLYWLKEIKKWKPTPYQSRCCRHPGMA